MSNLTDRTAYLRGLAEGLNIDREKGENRLMLEMLTVMDEMAQKMVEMDTDLGELDEYVESIDSDLSDIEDALFGEEGDFDEDDEEDDEPDVDAPILAERPVSPENAGLPALPPAENRLDSTLASSEASRYCGR